MPFILGWAGSNGGDFFLSFLLSFGVSASVFCQDDIKIARETHYGSLYIVQVTINSWDQNSRRVKSIGRLGLD